MGACPGTILEVGSRACVPECETVIVQRLLDEHNRLETNNDDETELDSCFQAAVDQIQADQVATASPARGPENRIKDLRTQGQQVSMNKTHESSNDTYVAFISQILSLVHHIDIEHGAHSRDVLNRNAVRSLLSSLLEARNDKISRLSDTNYNRKQGVGQPLNGEQVRYLNQGMLDSYHRTAHQELPSRAVERPVPEAAIGENDFARVAGNAEDLHTGETNNADSLPKSTAGNEEGPSANVNDNARRFHPAVAGGSGGNFPSVNMNGERAEGNLESFLASVLGSAQGSSSRDIGYEERNNPAATLESSPTPREESNVESANPRVEGNTGNYSPIVGEDVEGNAETRGVARNPNPNTANGDESLLPYVANNQVNLLDLVLGGGERPPPVLGDADRNNNAARMAIIQSQSTTGSTGRNSARQTVDARENGYNVVQHQEPAEAAMEEALTAVDTQGTVNTTTDDLERQLSSLLLALRQRNSQTGSPASTGGSGRHRGRRSAVDSIVSRSEKYVYLEDWEFIHRRVAKFMTTCVGGTL